MKTDTSTHMLLTERWLSRFSTFRGFQSTKCIEEKLGKCKEHGHIGFSSEKPSKSLQNNLFYALVSIKCGGNPLKTTNKLVGPVGKGGFWVRYIGCEMQEKPQKT